MSSSFTRARAALVAVTALAGAPGAGCTPDAHLFDEGARRPRADAGVVTSPAPGMPGSMSPMGPPALGPLALTATADCVRVRLEANAPADAVLLIARAAGADAALSEPFARFPLGSGATLFDAAVRPGGPGGVAVLAQIEADAAGMVLLSDAVAFTTVAPAGPLVITEVLANPAGAETRQEYVELTNLGDAPVTTAGLQIEDAAGFDPLPALSVPPQGHVLVVGASFDEAGPGDVPPRAGTLLLRVPGRIGKDGLGQQGEIVRLIAAGDAGPRVLSQYGGWVDVSRPAWAGKSVHRAPDAAACDHPQAWSAAPLPPTPGW
jgi:hypothetical protein